MNGQQAEKDEPMVAESEHAEIENQWRSQPNHRRREQIINPGLPGLLLPAADNDSRMGIRPRIRP